MAKKDTGNRTLNRLVNKKPIGSTRIEDNNVGSQLTGPTPVNAVDHANRMYRDETRGMTPEQVRLYTEQKRSDMRINAQEQIDQNRIQTRQAGRRTLGNRTKLEDGTQFGENTQANGTNLIKNPASGIVNNQNGFNSAEQSYVRIDADGNQHFFNGNEIDWSEVRSDSDFKTVNDSQINTSQGSIYKLSKEQIKERKTIRDTYTQIDSDPLLTDDEKIIAKEKLKEKYYGITAADLELLDEEREGETKWLMPDGKEYATGQKYGDNQRIDEKGSLYYIDPSQVEKDNESQVPGFDGMPYQQQKNIITSIMAQDDSKTYGEALKEARNIYSPEQPKAYYSPEAEPVVNNVVDQPVPTETRKTLRETIAGWFRKSKKKELNPKRVKEEEEIEAKARDTREAAIKAEFEKGV